MKKREIPNTTCAFCEKGVRMIDGETVLCEKKGPVPSDHTCRRFVFDPLKEKPTPTAQLFKKTKMETL